MKILGIFIFIFSLAASFNIGMDLLLGFSLPQAFFHLLNPFLVMGAGEYSMLSCMLLITIGHQIFMRRKNKTNS